MDYEKKYKEALERAKEWQAGKYGYCVSDTPQAIAEFIFPELKASEDEKMRKSIIYALRNGGFYDNDKTDEAIAWLEKLSEQTDIANKEYWRGYREGKQEILDKYAELEKQGEQKAIEAFRWTCPYVSILKRLNGTKEPYECFAYDCKTRHYRCKGNVCHRLRRFINILKEPQQ